MADWNYVGEIKLLQMQLYAMTGAGAYDLEALIEADTLRLTPDGFYGLSGRSWIMDRHHRDHPDSRYWHASEVLSFGFTSHYDHMWDLFRTTSLGIAGENIIVDAPSMLAIGWPPFVGSTRGHSVDCPPRDSHSITSFCSSRYSRRSAE